MAWEPPPRPALEGPLAPNTLLADVEIFGATELNGAEDIAAGLDGDLYTGTSNGVLWRLPLGNDNTVGAVERVADLNGSVLGLAAYSDHEVVAAVVGRGLILVDTETGDSLVLADRIDGDLIYFPDGVDVAQDGTVYFTEASTLYYPGFPLDFFDGRPHGRLLRYEPSTGRTSVVADDLHFANGVVVAPDESHAVVAESFRFRISRISLEGSDAGTVEPFADLINGPDNLRLDAEGRIWVGGGTLRNDLVDEVLASAELRRQLADLTREQIESQLDPYGFAVVLDPAGTPIFSFHDPMGGFTPSGALAHDGYVYFSTLADTGIARLPLPDELAE